MAGPNHKSPKPPATPLDRDIRRWLTDASGRVRPLPRKLKEDPVAFSAWIDQERAGDDLRAAVRRYGPISPQARAAWARAREAQDRVLAAVGETREEVVARYHERTRAGLDAITLLRY